MKASFLTKGEITPPFGRRDFGWEVTKKQKDHCLRQRPFFFSDSLTKARMGWPRLRPLLRHGRDLDWA